MHFLKKIIGIQIKNLIYFNFLDMFSIKSSSWESILDCIYILKFN